MALQTVQTVSRPGFNLTAAAVAADVAGDSWVNAGNQLVAVINGGGSPVVVTEPYQGSLTFDGVAPTAKTYSVPAGATALLGPFDPSKFNNPANGQTSITYSGVTNVKVCVFQLGQG